MVIDDYKSLMLQLLPRGRAWIGENLRALIGGQAAECARIDAQIAGLFAEALPATSDQCLADWERVAGIPDSIFPLAADNDGRRRNLVAKLSAQGGQSAAYFVLVAAQLGYSISITDGIRPLAAGFRAGARCYGPAWVYVFVVHVLSMPAGEVTVTDSGAGSLRRVRNIRLEMMIESLSPGHAVALFEYPA